MLCPRCNGPCCPGTVDGAKTTRHYCTVCRRFAAQGPKRERKTPRAVKSTQETKTDLEAAWDYWWSIFADPSIPLPTKHRFEAGRKFEIDRAWVGLRIAVELEGIDHRQEDRYHRDIEKYNLLAERGWVLLRFATRTLADDPEACVRQVERIIKIRGILPL